VEKKLHTHVFFRYKRDCFFKFGLHFFWRKFILYFVWALDLAFVFQKFFLFFSCMSPSVSANSYKQWETRLPLFSTQCYSLVLWQPLSKARSLCTFYCTCILQPSRAIVCREESQPSSVESETRLPPGP